MVRKKSKTPPLSLVKEREHGFGPKKEIPVEDVRWEANMKVEDSMRKLREENSELSQKLARSLDMEKKNGDSNPSYSSVLLAAKTPRLGDNPISRSSLEEMKRMQTQYLNEHTHRRSNLLPVQVQSQEEIDGLTHKQKKNQSTAASDLLAAKYPSRGDNLISSSSLEEMRVLQTQNRFDSTKHLSNSPEMNVQIQKECDGKFQNQKMRQSTVAVNLRSPSSQDFLISSDDLSLVLVDPQPSPIAQISPSFDDMNDSQLADIEAIIHQKKEERLKNALLQAREEALNSIDADHGAWITTTRGAYNSSHYTTQLRGVDLLDSGHGFSHTEHGASPLTIQTKANNVHIEEVNEKEEGEIIEGNDGTSSDAVDGNDQEDPNGVGILGVSDEDENNKRSHDSQAREETVSKDNNNSSQAAVQDKETQQKLSWASLVGRANGIGGTIAGVAVACRASC